MIHIEFLLCPRFLLCAGKIDSHFVPIPTLRRENRISLCPIPTLHRDNSGIEPHQVEIFTSPGEVIIPSLRRTILELNRFLRCAEHIYRSISIK